MKTKTIKLSVLAFLGLSLAVYGQDYSGKVGINTDKPNTTLEIKGKSDNTDKILEGLIIPNVSKNKAYLMTTNTEMPFKESTLIYVDNISDYTTSPVDTKVADITENGYYFWNVSKWVKATGKGGQEWVYNPTEQNIELKRSGTFPFVPKTYYSFNGGYKQIGISTIDPTVVNDAFLSKNYNHTYNYTLVYSNDTKGTLVGEFLVDNNNDDTDIVGSVRNSRLIIPSEQTKDRNYPSVVNNSLDMRGSGFVKDGNTVVNRFTMDKDSKSNTYVTASNSSVVLNTTGNVNKSIANRGSVNIQSSGIVNEAVGIEGYVYTAPSTTSNIKFVAALVGRTIYDSSIASIETSSVFYYPGKTSLEKTPVKNNYGLYLGNVIGGSIKNYAIYTNIGTVRFGDNVGIGVDTPNEKLEVAGAVKVGTTTNTCTSTNYGAIKFESDNFYGCKSTGWVLLSN
ncbi:hypothetical protein PG630_02790 [Riemerella anatipestifer]|nr:hypothetical protein [Riemerella anatipestifer]